REMLAQARKVTLFAAGAASQKYMQGLADQQEIMGALADSIMEVFALESCLLRAEKIVAARGEAAARQAIALTRYYAARAAEIIQARARRVIAAVAEGDMLRTQMAILRRLGKYEPADTIAIGRQIAAQVIGAGRYGV
ncbi:MAG: acyl-CoA dehydrogenase, partial [Bryobacteraceae bacterium]